MSENNNFFSRSGPFSLISGIFNSSPPQQSKEQCNENSDTRACDDACDQSDPCHLQTPAVEEEVEPPTKKARAPKKCSICRQAGHNKNHCPEVYAKESTSVDDILPDLLDVCENDLSSDEESPSTALEVSIPFQDNDEDDNESLEEDEVVNHNGECTIDMDEGVVDNDFPQQVFCEEEGDWTNSECHVLGDGEHLNYIDRPDFDVCGSGPRNIPRGCRDPVDFFLLFMNDTVIQTFVAATNMQAVRNFSSSRRGWSKPLDNREFLRFVALILYFGIMEIPEYKEAFNPKLMYYIPFVASKMTVTRFVAIWQSWKWDASVHSPRERMQKNFNDSFWSVRGLVDVLVDAFRKYNYPLQNLSIDEACIPFKGRHRDRQYNCSKPNKWHFKMFMLNCAETGYCFGFFFFQLRDPKRNNPSYPTDLSTSAYPVVRLLHEEYWHRNHVLHTDNWYSSMEVLKFCLSKGIDFIGTVLPKRKGLPKNGKFVKNERRIQRGAIKQMQTELQIPGRLDKKPCFFVAWYDRKPVHFLSSIKSRAFLIGRKVKDPITRTFSVKQIRAPTVMWLYNNGMGGTDLCDQNLSYYRNSMRSAKWQVRVFVYLIQLASLNAHILYKKYKALVRNDKAFRYKNFLEEVINGLCQEQPIGQRPSYKRQHGDGDDVSSSEPLIKKYIRLPDALKQQSSFTYHHPRFWPSRSTTSNGKISDIRPYCKICHAHTSYSCEECKVGLCLTPKIRGDHSTQCWKVFHTP